MRFVLVVQHVLDVIISSARRRAFDDPSLKYHLESEEYNDEYGLPCAVSLLGRARHLGVWCKSSCNIDLTTISNYFNGAI